jgi:hypothetical protein
MENIEEYISRVSKENEIVLDKKDPLCALHTILKMFEEDLLSSQKILLQEAAVQFRKLHEEHQEAYQIWDDQSKERVNKIMNATFTKSEAYLEECLKVLKNTTAGEQERTKQIIQVAINEAIATSVPRISSPLHDPLVQALIGSNLILGAGYIILFFFLM